MNIYIFCSIFLIYIYCTFLFDHWSSFDKPRKWKRTLKVVNGLIAPNELNKKKCKMFNSVIRVNFVHYLHFNHKYQVVIIQSFLYCHWDNPRLLQFVIFNIHIKYVPVFYFISIFNNFFIFYCRRLVSHLFIIFSFTYFSFLSFNKNWLSFRFNQMNFNALIIFNFNKFVIIRIIRFVLLSILVLLVFLLP